MAYLAKFDPTFNDWRNNTNTMNTKHTPGPWTIGRVGTTQGQHIAITSPDGDHIATVGEAINSPNGSGNAYANASLIASAPDLLEALQMLSEKANLVSQGAPVVDERGFNTLAHSISAALAAIDKATK